MRYILAGIVIIAMPICFYILTKKFCEEIDEFCDDWEKRKNEK